MQNTPASLLEQLRRPSDPKAWEHFVTLYTPFLYHCMRPLGLQEADKADVLQEVFLLLYRKLPEFHYDGTKSFRGWLRTVLRNKWHDLQRQRSPVPVSSSGVADPAAADDTAVFADQEYRDYLVNRALGLMKADFQPATWQACWQTVVHGRPATEVARELGVTVDAVYAATYRVLRRLRTELDGLLS
jgi:RNA polymerase sigma-70 factor (ECF subfamily)